MIIWLASYPRSGNTLFRTICRHCFGIYSYADEPVNYESEFRSNSDLIGHREIPEEWSKFYRHATQASDIYLVKTHRPPIDSQPYVYVVRDGRSSIISYQKFNIKFNNIEMSRVGLILGIGGYGSWSGHYDQWNKRTGIKHLILRYEDLVDISDNKLMQVADFFDYGRKPSPWVNPIDRLKEVEPGFFGTRNKQFTGDRNWTQAHEYLFAKIHGELMLRLGYYKSGNALERSSDFPAHTDRMVSEILSYIKELQQENRLLSQTCNERLELIHQLNDICEERLRLINQLNEQGKK